LVQQQVQQPACRYLHFGAILRVRSPRLLARLWSARQLKVSRERHELRAVVGRRAHHLGMQRRVPDYSGEALQGSANRWPRRERVWERFAASATTSNVVSITFQTLQDRASFWPRPSSKRQAPARTTAWQGSPGAGHER